MSGKINYPPLFLFSMFFWHCMPIGFMQERLLLLTKQQACKINKTWEIHQTLKYLRVEPMNNWNGLINKKRRKNAPRKYHIPKLCLNLEKQQICSKFISVYFLLHQTGAFFFLSLNTFSSHPSSHSWVTVISFLHEITFFQERTGT